MESEAGADDELSHRDRALLRAVAEGRAELVGGCEPDLTIDGYWCGDQSAAHRLAQLGLIAPASPIAVGGKVAAVLTTVGNRALGHATAKGA
ncbi:hypothetical protein EV191_10759 [Tamaricihabitans halophyticus]|uniref:Uncharacterized protein n=1 Tax=Tamaricihabitans halophyticus TaxID=1262583 RepID=A0A4R2QQ59_9PSEU|nr:hypothetical protein [Tamaricihabitans halophyticus]TCP50798.1 hypothetical protein EV191_10759 [Tamaricihabitans halophyticus]